MLELPNLSLDIFNIVSFYSLLMSSLAASTLDFSSAVTLSLRGSFYLLFGLKSIPSV